MQISDKEVSKIKFFKKYDRALSILFLIMTLLLMILFVINALGIKKLANNYGLGLNQVLTLLSTAELGVKYQWYHLEIMRRLFYGVIILLGLLIFPTFYLVGRKDLQTSEKIYNLLKQTEKQEQGRSAGEKPSPKNDSGE